MRKSGTDADRRRLHVATKDSRPRHVHSREINSRSNREENSSPPNPRAAARFEDRAAAQSGRTRLPSRRTCLATTFPDRCSTLYPSLLATYRVAAAEWLASIVRYNSTMKTLLTLIAVAFLGVI